MATNITVYIGSMDVSSYVRDVYIWRRQNRFQIKMWNPDGILSGVIAADALVQIYLDGLPFYKGYVDNVQPTIRETAEACFEHTLLVSGRDVSQDMWNKVWDKVYHGKADDIIEDILTNSGCEVTFDSPSTAPVIYYDCRQMFVGDAVREILDFIDYDGYVDWNKQLHIFPIGTVSSGITLRAVRGGTENNIIRLVEHVEKDAADIKNYIIALGGSGRTVDDAWTECTANQWQISPSDKWALTDVYLPSELGEYLSGVSAIKAYRTQTPSTDKGDVVFRLTFPRFNKDYLAWSKIRKEDLVFTTAVKATSYMFDFLIVRLKDTNGKVIYTGPSTPGFWGTTPFKWETNIDGSPKPQVWVFPVGKDMKPNVMGSSWWFGDNDFNWNVKEIEIVFCGGNVVTSSGDKCLEFYLDGLIIPVAEGEPPIIAVAQDQDSQQLYKVRKAFYHKKDIKSQVLLQQFADSILRKRKAPLERLRLLCVGSAGKIGNSWNWILGANVTVNIPDEEINNRVYRMIEIVHRLGIETMQTYGYDHVVELSLVPYNQPVDLTRWSYETGEIGILRSLHERLTHAEREKIERRDWFSALPAPLGVRTEDVKIPIYQPVFGETAAGTTRYMTSTNQLVASKFSLTTSYDEKPAFIGVYVKAGSNEAKIKAAVYSDNSNYPGSLLDWSEFVTVPANFDGQIIIPLTQNTHLSSGDYWLAVWTSAPIEIYAKTGSSKSATVNFNGFPDPFPSGGSTVDYTFSVYYGVFTTKTVADWQDKTFPDKIDTDALSRPTQVLVGGYIDESLEKPTITVVSEELDTNTVFRTWLRITIQRINDAVGYIVSYRKEGAVEWTQFYVPQPSSGNIEAVTADLEENTYYEVKAAAVYPNSKVSGWCSVQTVKTAVNNTPPFAPSNITCTPGLNALFLECSAVNASDFSHYEWYASTSSPPLTIIGTSKTPYFVWKTPSYSAYYVGVRSVDTAGNKSSLTASTSTYTPLQVGSTDIAPNAVTAEKILDGAVTDVKLASGAVTLAKFASGIRPVQIVNSLPTLPDPNYPQGAVVFLTTDNKLYRSTGTSWTAVVPTSDLSGTITTSQIADDAVTAAKLANNVQPFVADITLTPRSGYEHDQISYSSGTITLADGTTQSITAGTLNLSSATGWWYIYFTIGSSSLAATQTYSDVLGANRGLLAIAFHSTDSSQQVLILPFRSKGLNIQADAIAAGAITTAKLSAGCVTADKIAAGAITGDKIAAGTITGDKIAAGTITGSHIAADTITAGNIAAGAVGTSELAAGAVTADKIQAGAVTASKLTVAQIFIEGLTFTDNSPSSGYVSWTAHTIYYQGAAYSISAGNTNLKYIYWDVGNTTLSASNTKPSWSDTRFMIAINDGGYHKTVWNATYIHGGTLITGTVTAQEIAASAVTTEKLVSGAVTTDKLAANAVTADKIAASAVTAEKIAAGAVTADKIAAGAVTAEKIAAGQVNTDHIRFNSLTSDPAYEAGKMWWRSDVDQLRFASGTTLDKVAIIPKYPLYDIQAPPENYLPNAYFEIDRDNDGVPDSWEKVAVSGSPTFEIAPNPNYPNIVGKRGAKSAVIRLTGAGEGLLRSVFIPVEVGKTYYISVYVRGSLGKTHDKTVLLLEVFDKDKSYSDSKWNGVDPPSDWKTTSTSWTLKTWTYTIPTSMTARDGSTQFEPKYVRVVLRNYCTSTDYETVFYNGVVLSEIRSSSPTSSVVAAGATAWDITASVTGGVWTNIVQVGPWNVDTEFTMIFISLNHTVSSNNIWFRAYDGSVYYPTSDGIKSVTGSGNFTFVITIPGNLKGKNVTVQMKSLYSMSVADWACCITIWSHGIHFHR